MKKNYNCTYIMLYYLVACASPQPSGVPVKFKSFLSVCLSVGVSVVLVRSGGIVCVIALSR